MSAVADCNLEYCKVELSIHHIILKSSHRTGRDLSFYDLRSLNKNTLF